ncbi:hypothetical protein Tco_0091859 [Tanacetum coccineum]
MKTIIRLADLKEFKKVNEICAKNRVLHISLLHRLLRAQHTSISSELVPVDKVFVGARLHVTEGVLNGGREVDSLGLWLDRHGMVFVGARLHVTEGVLNGGREVDSLGLWLDRHGMVTS